MLIEDLAMSASVGKQADIILLDFSKAFDTVNHSEPTVAQLEVFFSSDYLSHEPFSLFHHGVLI